MILNNEDKKKILNILKNGVDKKVNVEYVNRIIEILNDLKLVEKIKKKL